MEHQSRQNLSTINFTATFARTASSCNTVMEKCLHKATFKRVRNQILKGADPERAARRGYENACDYFELTNKKILIQQRALACLSKSVAHILQRELYTMGNTGLLRREAEITLLQPHLGDSRRQELRNSPFWPIPLFKSELVKDGEDILRKKGTPKDSQGFGPYQNRRGYEEVAEYMDFWNKTVLIQHRALTCLSKSLAHILQRELYSMANTGLLRCEAEMTLLQPHLGEMRRQELRNSSFWDPSLFESQLMKEGEDFLLKKGTSKDSQGFAPYQNKPFCGPHHNKKRGSYRKGPYGGNSSQSSNQLFSSGRGKPNFRGSRGNFQPHSRGRGRGNPSSQ